MEIIDGTLEEDSNQQGGTGPGSRESYSCGWPLWVG